MGISRTLTRLADYYSRHGFVATIRRLRLAAKRAMFYNRMVVFYCDLARQATLPADLPDSLKVERLTTYSGLNPEDLQELTSFWHPKQAHRDIRERFEKGASLWLIRSGGKLAGYGWTLQGCTIAPYFFRLGKDDVSLFDFYAFPRFRGRAIHWILTAYILQTLGAEGRARAFGDTAEWNQAQLASLKMTPFHRLGMARSFTIFGHTFVSWTENKPGEVIQKDLGRRNEAPSLARLHER
jgi:hypothetical protein